MAQSHKKSGNTAVGSIVGTLIKLIFLVAIAGSVYYYFNNGNEIKKEIREQSTIIESLNAKLASQQLLHDAGRKNQITALEIESYVRQLQLLEERMTSTKDQIELITKKTADTKESWKQYRESYRKAVRASMIGTKYDEFTTQSGKKYQKVIIKNIDDQRISLQHENGSASIDWKELSPDLIDRLQFSDELADITTKAEQDAAELFHSDASKSFVIEVIAEIDKAIKTEEDKFRVKCDAYNAARPNTVRAIETIGKLQVLIAIQEKKQGARRTQQYLIQIDAHKKLIEEENKRIVEFPMESAKHHTIVSNLKKRRVLYEQKLAQMEK